MREYFDFHKAFQYTRFTDAITGKPLCKWEVWASLSDVSLQLAIMKKEIFNVRITPLAGTENGIITDMKKFKETQNITDEIL